MHGGAKGSRADLWSATERRDTPQAVGREHGSGPAHHGLPPHYFEPPPAPLLSPTLPSSLHPASPLNPPASPVHPPARQPHTVASLRSPSLKEGQASSSASPLPLHLPASTQGPSNQRPNRTMLACCPLGETLHTRACMHLHTRSQPHSTHRGMCVFPPSPYMGWPPTGLGKKPCCMMGHRTTTREGGPSPAMRADARSASPTAAMVGWLTRSPVALRSPLRAKRYALRTCEQAQGP